MTSTPPTNASPRNSVEPEEGRRTSIVWTTLPEGPTSEGRRQSTLTTTVSAPAGTSPVIHNPQPSASPSIRSGRSLSSPPPPPAFLKRVSFDTFDNKDATDFSLTLKSKHRDYSYSRRSRTFLCGTDQNDYSEFALEWLIDELVDDGDEIVCLRVVDKDSKMSSDVALQEGRYRQEAQKLLDRIIEKNEDEKAISIILEFAVGKVHEVFQKMIHIYEPVILIVGTRGRSLGGLQGLMPGSVSKYCLQHSPVPVIVVRPSSKRDKKKAKRRADPGRKVYQDILQQSSELMLHSNNSLSKLGEGSSAAPSITDESTSPKTAPMSLSDSPSPGTLTPAPASLNDSTLVGSNIDLTACISPLTTTDKIDPLTILEAIISEKNIADIKPSEDSAA